jgi:hypothetical protein
MTGGITVPDVAFETAPQAVTLDLTGKIQNRSEAEANSERRTVCVSAAGEIEGVPVQDIVVTDDVRSEGRYEIQLPILDERVVGRRRCHFKLAISIKFISMLQKWRKYGKQNLPETTHIDLPCPCVFSIEFLELIVHHQA